MASGTLDRCSLHGWTPVQCTGQMAVCWCQRCGSSGPWGYVMGRRMLWTTNTTITSCCSMIMHGPMLQRCVHNSCKLKTTQFLHGQHTHRTCHPLSMFGMLWIGVYNSVFQFLPISSNFSQPLKRSGPTFHRPQSTTWSTLCEGDVAMREANGGHTRYWLVFGPPPRTPQYNKTAHFRVAFYCGQPKAHLCNNHAI